LILQCAHTCLAKAVTASQCSHGVSGESLIHYNATLSCCNTVPDIAFRRANSWKIDSYVKQENNSRFSSRSVFGAVEQYDRTSENASLGFCALINIFRPRRKSLLCSRPHQSTPLMLLLLLLLNNASSDSCSSLLSTTRHADKRNDATERSSNGIVRSGGLLLRRSGRCQQQRIFLFFNGLVFVSASS